MQRQCYLTVLVANTDYDEPDEFILHTTANGEKVHGRCSPLATIWTPAAVTTQVNGAPFFECAKRVLLPPSSDGTYVFVTTATPAVDERKYDDSFVHVDFRPRTVSKINHHETFRSFRKCLGAPFSAGIVI